ncbi:ATP-binding protein [Sporomusa aerivorans]|uniref:ATP-binding protein n=1 Tax=Sporomusa aerivorans TaxID=204936 RepID=UPI00352AF78C
MKLIMGNTGSGKTLKALEIGVKLAESGKKVLFFDGEISSEHYLKQILQHKKLPVGFSVFERIQKVEDVYSKIEYGGHDVYIIDTPKLYFDLEKLNQLQKGNAIYFVLGLEDNVHPDINKNMVLITTYKEMKSLFSK